MVVIASGTGEIVVGLLGFASRELPGGQVTEVSPRFSCEASGALLFPFGPIIVVATLDLMRGGGCTPEKTIWKFEYFFSECIHTYSIQNCGNFEYEEEKYKT